MWKKILTMSLVLVMVLSFTACAKPAPAPAPAPTPAPAPIPSPPRVDDQTLDMLSPVCRGQGVEQAAPYTGGPPHRLVSLDSDGNAHPWIKEIPEDWCPSSLNDVELVLVVGEEKEKLVQTCEYEGGPDIKRYRYSMDVELREAKSGETVSCTIIYGTMPRPCEKIEEVALTRVQGSPVSFTQLQRWLERYVMDKEKVATPDTATILTLAVVVPGWSDVETVAALGELPHTIIGLTSTEIEQCTLDEAAGIEDNLLGPYGFDYTPTLMLASEALRALEVGLSDCAFIWAKHPWQPLQDGDYRFLSLSADARVLASDGWDNVEPAVIPANTYRNQPEDVMTVGMYR